MGLQVHKLTAANTNTARHATVYRLYTVVAGIMFFVFIFFRFLCFNQREIAFLQVCVHTSVHINLGFDFLDDLIFLLFLRWWNEKVLPHNRCTVNRLLMSFDETRAHSKAIFFFSFYVFGLFFAFSAFSNQSLSSFIHSFI